ncbi:hypothetical protein KPL76_06245 [Subtercola sp. PAMC28395]|uniref:hypothetical protein n=1 Tax=Subtercola sp. PAMC28395 TaxID=2846775 RepID=UPI001C0DC4EC|nr:hypothetical protein [Subtercola sp. PAMC28395]QWT24954.1 hypothetical protein KPL76_06245 [Subtercola sp. PAMC28395]
MTEEEPLHFCITNTMTDVRSCTVKDEHQIVCDGYEYRRNPQHGGEEATGRECRGCLPRIAQVGLLCYSCYDKVLHAYSAWTEDRRRILASIDRAVQRDNGGVRTAQEGYVPLPGTMLALDEVASYLRTDTGTFTEWLSKPEGAADSLRFARAVTAAQRTHELEEKAHRVQRIRCPKCQQQSLVWKPTMKPDDHVTITCQNSSCDAELDQPTFELEESLQTHTNRVNVLPENQEGPLYLVRKKSA